MEANFGKGQSYLSPRGGMKRMSRHTISDPSVYILNAAQLFYRAWQGFWECSPARLALSWKKAKSRKFSNVQRRLFVGELSRNISGPSARFVRNITLRRASKVPRTNATCADVRFHSVDLPSTCTSRPRLLRG